MKKSNYKEFKQGARYFFGGAAVTVLTIVVLIGIISLLFLMVYSVIK